MFRITQLFFYNVSNSLSFLLKKVNKILSMSMSCAKFYMKLFLITFIWNRFNHLYPRYCHIFSNSQFNHYKFWTKHCQSYRRSLFQLAQMQNIQNLIENKRNIIVKITRFNGQDTLRLWDIEKTLPKNPIKFLEKISNILGSYTLRLWENSSKKSQ